jgi:2-dehydropantoate 2-reductase
MRFVVIGAGAIGGVLAARLRQHGYDVVLAARGAHGDMIARHGLILRTPHETISVELPVVSSVADLGWCDGDVALLAVKSQATAGVLSEIAAVAPARTPIVCLQNGVENEREALRRFPDVYAVPVLCPAAYLEPGVVEAYAVRTTGIMDVGRYPWGSDDTARAVSAAFVASGYVSQVRDDIMRWKWIKLIANLANAVEAICEPGPGITRLTRQARREGWAVYAAAGIDTASRAEDAAHRGDLLDVGDVGDGGVTPRAGGSTWQSLARSTGDVETDYLNGEIVLHGRLHGVPTPLNDVLQRLARRLAVDRRPPGVLTEEEILAELAHAWRP